MKLLPQDQEQLSTHTSSGLTELLTQWWKKCLTLSSIIDQ